MGAPRAVGIEVEVEGAGGCLSSARLARSVGSTLGVDEAPAPVPALVRVAARALPVGYEVRVEVEVAAVGRRERVLEVPHPSCDEVRDAVVLVAALLVDELWAESRKLRAPVPKAPVPAPARPSEAPSPAPRRSSEPAVPAARPPERAQTPAPRAWLETGLLAAMSVADLAPVAGGLALDEAVLAPARVTVHLRALAWPLAVVGDGRGKGARFSAFELGVLPCVRAVDRLGFDLAPCLGVRAGAVYVVGVGLDRVDEGVRPRVLLDVELASSVHMFGPLWFVGGLGLAVPLVRDRFEYMDAAGEAVLVHRSAAVAPTFRLGLAVRAGLRGGRARGRSESRRRGRTK